MSTCIRKRVAVVGGGIAGLGAAYYLRKQGIESTIIERDKVLGGKTRSTIRDERYVVDLGPCLFFENETPLMRLAGDLSIKEFIVEGKPAYKIWTGRGFQNIPRGKIYSFAQNALSRISIFSSGKKSAEHDEREKMVSRIFQDGKMPPLSFRWGMGTLSARLEEELGNRAETSAAVKSIEQRRDRTFRIRLENTALPMEADAVVVATPAQDAAKMLQTANPEASKLLSEISYSPLIVVHAAFAEKDAPKLPEGFGVMVGRRGGTRIIFSILSSVNFPGRCPKGEVLISSYLGGEGDVVAIEMSDDEISGEVISGIQKVFGIRTEPKFTHIKRWVQAAPVSTEDSFVKARSIARLVSETPGVFITGGYFAGFSVSDTIAHARNEVDRVAGYLKSLSPSP